MVTSVAVMSSRAACGTGKQSREVGIGRKHELNIERAAEIFVDDIRLPVAPSERSSSHFLECQLRADYRWPGSIQAALHGCEFEARILRQKCILRRIGYIVRERETSVPLQPRCCDFRACKGIGSVVAKLNVSASILMAK